jgi:hypothetical protein
MNISKNNNNNNNNVKEDGVESVRMRRRRKRNNNKNNNNNNNRNVNNSNSKTTTTPIHTKTNINTTTNKIKNKYQHNNHRSILKTISYFKNNPHTVEERNKIGTMSYQPLAALLPSLIQCRDERRRIRQIRGNEQKQKQQQQQQQQEAGSQLYLQKPVQENEIRHNSRNNHNDKNCVGQVDKQADKQADTEMEEKDHYNSDNGNVNHKNHNDDNDHGDDSDDEWIVPKSMKIYFDDLLVQAMKDENEEKRNGENNMVWKKYFENANQYKPVRMGTNMSMNTNMSTSVIHSATTATTMNYILQSADKAFQYLSNAKLIVGFHPDQATEAIIDLALYLKVPFCIVPCCVFPREFPNRFLFTSSTSPGHSPKNNCSGNVNDNDKQRIKKEQPKVKVRVRDYHTLIEYLKNKDKRIRVDELNFYHTETARKIVLYMLPEDFV